MSESLTTVSKPRRRIRRRAVALVVGVASLAGAAGIAQAHHTGFPDVPSGAFYHDPVHFAVQNGITDGYGDTGLFRPELNITRGEVVTFLHRYHENLAPATETLTAQLNLIPHPHPNIPVQAVLGKNIGATGASGIGGNYTVAFDRDLSDCWYQVSPLTTAARTATVSGTNNTHALLVVVRNQNGSAADSMVHVEVTCPAS